MPRLGQYDLRIVVLRRVLGSQGANAEHAETWPEPQAGTNEYFAARDELSAGEEIRQAIRQATGTMNLRIRGRSIPIAAVDRIRVKTTGELFNVTGVFRERADTVISVERLQQQSVGQ